MFFFLSSIFFISWTFLMFMFQFWHKPQSQFGTRTKTIFNLDKYNQVWNGCNSKIKICQGSWIRNQGLRIKKAKDHRQEWVQQQNINMFLFSFLYFFFSFALSGVNNLKGKDIKISQKYCLNSNFSSELSVHSFHKHSLCLCFHFDTSL